MIADRVDVTWIAFIRGDCFSAEIAQLMKAAGCHQVLVGIESGDEGIMRNIGKPIEKDRYRKAVRIAHEHGIEVRLRSSSAASAKRGRRCRRAWILPRNWTSICSS